MKKTKIIYWIFTVLVLLLMGVGAVPSIIKSEDSVKLIHDHLNYPVYFVPFTGVAKLLGCIALLVPGYPRVKEWAYAGLAFDLMGAIYSFICVGDPASGWFPLVIGLACIAGSYIYYHKLRKLKAASNGTSYSGNTAFA
ncbi:DoxX family protein [Pinibacter soli]|uniref:DoxX family protein n=1 Tax=Pinibacter soli TaxID=3044211 RepID=A0ABT6RCS2_9BACT|nr:DoxX family protein [Pinibacter soli]MDI3320196.1 DoxX family protein [Pinibacter soli]